MLEALLLVAVASALAQEVPIDVGIKLNVAMVPKRNRDLCAATPSQLYPCLMDVKIKGIKFSVIGYDPKTLQIRYLLIEDERFRTKEGFRVGDIIEVAENELVPVSGWHLYGPRTEDGWHPILGADSLVFGNTIKSVDGDSVDMSKRIIGKSHHFKIIGFDKGGV